MSLRQGNVGKLVYPIRSVKAKSWEFTNEQQMFWLLVGKHYGPQPEKKKDRIRLGKKQFAREIISELKITKEDHVVDLGSGSGYIARWIAPDVSKLYCCDISESFISRCKDKLKDFENVEFHTINSMSLPFLRNSSVDVVYSTAVFIHLNLYDIYGYLDEFRRVLKRGGRVWFDIFDAERLNLKKDKVFINVANGYKKWHQVVSTGLVQWNSLSAVVEISRYFGFKVVKIHEKRFLKLIKQ